ncbi:MAG: hypothetical protein WBO17_13400 [Sphingorhabdus sp.]
MNTDTLKEPDLVDIISLKMLGLAGVASYAAARLAAKAGVIGYRRYAIVVVPVLGMPSMPRGFCVRQLSLEHLASHAIDVAHAVQSERMAQGLTCLGAFNSRDELVGVNWVGTGPFTESEVHVTFALPLDAGWDCGLWIAPRYRLGRGFAALWAGTADWLQKNDRQSSISWIADYNLPSLLSHKRMGARTIGHMTALRFSRWQYMARGVPTIVCTRKSHPALLDLSLT